MPGAWVPEAFAPGASAANIALFRSGAINADQLRATVGLGPMTVDSPGVLDTALSSPATLVIAGVLTAGLADAALTAGDAAAADGRYGRWRHDYSSRGWRHDCGRGDDRCRCC
jgi:hypothetical protein